MNSYGNRLIRAMKLDPSLYEEVEADRSATGQAILTVVLASLAAGLGGLLTGSFTGLVLHSFMTLVGWYVWAFLSYFIGTRLLPESQTKADMGELLRCTGFSSAPGILQIVGIFPYLGSVGAAGGILRLAIWIWMLVAFVIAVRQALDFAGTGRALAVCLIGWIILMAMDILFFLFSVGRVTL